MRARASFHRTLVTFVFLFAATPLLAMDLEEVIAKHIAAKGGRENWQKIQSIRASGEYTAFSKITPFTLHRKRDNKYHLDHTMNDHRVIIGFDGETSWWDNGFYEAGPQAITEQADLAALKRDIEFSTPFFDYQDHGLQISLIEGKNEIEGIPAIALEVKNPDETVDTWYLDPETYLELGRDSPGSDFGQPMPTRTFFDEFREIAGVKIPHFIESQWYTRHRVMDIAELEVNVDIDDQLFSMPVATGMELFQNMLGEWTVKVAAKQSPFQPEFSESSRDSVITASLNGGWVQESFTDQDGSETVRIFSYDRYRDRYILTQMDDARTYLDLQTGQFDGEVLTVSNIETDTSFDTLGGKVHERCSLSAVTEDGFSLQVENSIDGGENWAVMQKLTYTRKDAEEIE